MIWMICTRSCWTGALVAAEGAYFIILDIYYLHSTGWSVVEYAGVSTTRVNNQRGPKHWYGKRRASGVVVSFDITHPIAQHTNFD